jgi:hypothetical protein
MRDAITLTRRLGVRYLWIDALCIIQDSEQDWHELAVRMGEIYSNGFVSISAHDATDHLSTPASYARETLSRREAASTPQLFPESPQSLQFPKNPYQREGYLPKYRKARGSVEKKCLELTRLDAAGAIPTPKSPALGPQRGYLGIRIIGPRLELAATASANACTVKNTGAVSNISMIWIDTAAGMDLVQEYSGRKLTYAKDRLPAIAGLASAFQGEVFAQCNLCGRTVVREYRSGDGMEKIRHRKLW